MNDWTVLTPDANLFFIEVLQSLFDEAIESPPTAAVEMLRKKLGGSFVYAGQGATSRRPKWVAGWNADNAVLVVHGTDLPTQVPLQILGIIDFEILNTIAEPTQPYSYWTRNAYLEIYDILLTTGFFVSKDFWFVGHSAGHGIAAGVLGHRLSQPGIGPMRRANLTTYGGNGFCGANFARLLSQVNTARWMNTGDGVPLAPWIFADLAPSGILFNDFAVQRIANFVHTPGGLLIQPDGTFAPAINPTTGIVNRSLSMAEWISSFIFGNTTSHPTAEYAKRFELMKPKPTEFRPRSQPIENAFNSPPFSQPEIRTRSDAAQLATQFQDSAAAYSREVAAAQGRRIESDRFYPKRVGEHWVVMRKGATVVISNGKKDARRIARNLNRLYDAASGLGVVVNPF